MRGGCYSKSGVAYQGHLAGSLQSFAFDWALTARLVWQVFDLQEYRPGPVLKRIWKNFQAQQDAGDTWAPIVRGCCP